MLSLVLTSWVMATCSGSAGHVLSAHPLLRLRGGVGAGEGVRPSAIVTTEKAFGHIEEALGEGLKRLYGLPTYSATPTKRGGRGSYEFSEEESRTFVRIVRAMRHVSILYTLNGILQFASVLQLLPLKGLGELSNLSNCIDNMSAAYLILVASTAFEAIAETTGSDLDFLMAAIDSLRELWAYIRWPLALHSAVLSFKVMGPVIAPSATALICSPH